MKHRDILTEARNFGRRDRDDGLTETCNPYQPGTAPAQRAAWLHGWRNRDAELAALKKLETMEPAPKRKPGGYYRGH